MKLADFKPSDVMWDVDDDYSSVRCVRIRDPKGEPTEFGMVYGKDEKDGVYKPVRPVSDRYQPVDLGSILSTITERFPDVIDFKKSHVRTDRFGTMVNLRVPFGDPIVVDDKPFDAGTEFTRFGTPTKQDALRQSLSIRTSYNGLTSVSVAFGVERLVCVNGMYELLGSSNVSNIHTIHQVSDLIEKLGTMNFAGEVEMVQKMFKHKLTKAQLDRIRKMIPKKRQDRFNEYVELGSSTAYAAYNFVAYLQSHEYAVARGGQLDPTLRAIAKIAA